MKRIVLSGRARDDLASIAAHTRERWGKRKQQTYLDQIKTCLKALATMPDLGRVRAELGEDVRSLLTGRHVVFYTHRPHEVHILRVLHVSMDPEQNLKD